MAGVLASPRRRRRLARGGGAVAVLGGLALLAVLGPRVEREPERMSSEPAVVLTTPRSVALTAEVKEATIATANEFLRTAVAREQPEQAWDLVVPELREGSTRESWASGEIPVVPYPVDSAVYKLDYSQAGLVGWRVSVYPPEGSDARPMTFFMDVRLTGGGGERRWLVSNWSPASLSAPSPGAGAAAEGRNPFAIAPVGVGAELESRISPGWLLLPLALLGLPVAFVAAKLLRDRRRTAAAERAYRSTTSPS